MKNLTKENDINTIENDINTIENATWFSGCWGNITYESMSLKCNFSISEVTTAPRTSGKPGLLKSNK